VFQVKKLLGLVMEVGVLCAAGAAFGLAVNALRADNRVVLSRNYFHRGDVRLQTSEPVDRPTAAGTTGSVEDPHAAADPGDEQPLALEDNEYGIAVLSFEQVCEIFDDPTTGIGLNVFVDARGDDGFNAGHIPGAIQLDHYRIAKYLQPAMDRLEAAEQIIVYCNGGDCEDSLFVCQDLIFEGIPVDRLRLYKGGWEEWEENEQPVETVKEKR
jgi:rhodanese-related sulfurtransferase